MEKSNIDNKFFTTEQVINILKGYKELERKALQLEFEIKHYRPAITDDDMIDSMTFSHTLGENAQSGHVSDKTSKIAISYSEKAMGLNIKHKQELTNDLEEVRLEMKRLEYYIGLLEDKYADVLRLMYLEYLTYAATSEKLDIPLATVQRLRNKAIKNLTEMYSRIISN